MTLRQRLLIGLLIAANLVAGAIVFSRSYLSGSITNPVSVAQSQKLPLINLQDDYGQTFSTSRFAGVPLFVQFVNAHVERQIASIAYVRANRPKRPLSWLLITNDAHKLRAKLPRDSEDIVIVDGDYDHLRDLFSVPKCCEKWLIFDESGKLKSSGSYDTGDVVGNLRSVVDGEQPYSPALFAAVLNSMNQKRELVNLHAKAARSPSGKAIIVIFSKVCTGCSEKSLLDMVKKYAKQQTKITYIALLPNTFNQTDLKNFKTNLEIHFPVELAGQALSEAWMHLNEQYGENKINGTVVLLSNGQIPSVVNGLSETEYLLRGLGE